jgi:hypothetical protein
VISENLTFWLIKTVIYNREKLILRTREQDSNTHHQVVNHVLNLPGFVSLNITVKLIVEITVVAAAGVRRRSDELNLDLTASGVQSGVFKFLLDRTFQVFYHSFFARAALLKQNQTDL